MSKILAVTSIISTIALLAGTVINIMSFRNTSKNTKKVSEDISSFVKIISSNSNRNIQIPIGAAPCKFSDIAGNYTAKKEMQSVVKMLKNIKKYKENNVEIPTSILISGPPGTGKTMLARAAAYESSCPVIATGGSDYGGQFVADASERLRMVCSTAEKIGTPNKPTIIIIDEIDAIAKKRGGVFGKQYDQTVETLLTCIDGLSGESDRIIWIFTTNFCKELDSAFMRRIKKDIKVSLPNCKERIEIAKLLLKKKNHNVNEKELKLFSGCLYGHPGSKIKTIINEAAAIAMDRTLSYQDLVESFLINTMGLPEKTRKITSKEIKSTAYHEAGHALVYWILSGGRAEDILRISIEPRGKTNGHVLFSFPDEFPRNKKDMEISVSTDLGGRIGENMLGDGYESTGVGSDLEKARAISVAAANLAMTEKIILPGESNDKKIKKAAEKFAVSCYQKASEAIKENEEVFYDLVDYLIKKKTINGSEFASFIQKYKKTENISINVA